MQFRDDPVAVLLASRAKHFAALRSSEDGVAIAHLEAAYEALTGSPPPALVWDVPDGMSTAPAAQVAQRVLVDRTKRSVRGKAQTLLDEGPKTWHYEEIMAEWEHRGDPIEAADSRAALRTALWSLVKAGAAMRLADGGYRSVKFWPPTEEVP